MTGWKLVPVEATEEMKDATYNAHARAETVFTTAENVWEAELQAAPAPTEDVLERMGEEFLISYAGGHGLAGSMRAALAAAEERGEQASIPTTSGGD